MIYRNTAISLYTSQKCFSTIHKICKVEFDTGWSVCLSARERGLGCGGCGEPMIYILVYTYYIIIHMWPIIDVINVSY